MTAFGKNVAVYSTLMHTLELVVIFGVSFGVVKLFSVDSETYTVILGLITSSLAKFARASDSIPVTDYVNE